MEILRILSHSGGKLVAGHGRIEFGRPWVVIIIPFGLKIDLAKALIGGLGDHYNIVSWEARAILESADYQVSNNELSVKSHTSDLIEIMNFMEIPQATLLGYCSGAGIAIAAANQHPNRFTTLILANGEYTLLHKKDCITQYGSDIDGILPIAANSEADAQFIIDKMPASKEDEIPRGLEMPFSEAHILKRYAENYLEYRSTDFEALAKNIQHRTFVLTSKMDRQANVNSSLRIHNLIPKSEIFIDNDSDHFGVLRENSKMIEKILEIVNSIA